MKHNFTDTRDTLIALLGYFFSTEKSGIKCISDRRSGRTYILEAVIREGKYYFKNEQSKENFIGLKQKKGWLIENPVKKSFIDIEMENKNEFSVFDYDRNLLIDMKIEDSLVSLESISKELEKKFVVN